MQCERCGGPTIELFTGVACKAECDLQTKTKTPGERVCWYAAIHESLLGHATDSVPKFVGSGDRWHRCFDSIEKAVKELPSTYHRTHKICFVGLAERFHTGSWLYYRIVEGQYVADHGYAYEHL